MSLGEQAAGLLDKGGAFADAGGDFTPRAGQIRLAREIGEAIEAGEHLVAEAGTGIGKTLAYLVPILGCKKRAIISTATRTLQEQIYKQDLPRVARVLGRARRVAVLKGRDNYLCRERWLRLGDDWVGFGNAVLDTAALTAWVRSTETGDLAELRGAGEHSGLRRMLTVSAEACTGADCPEFSRCHVYIARARAQAAEVVIVNHHLLLADLRLKQEGAQGLLGPAGVIVVDEAHALPDIARNVLGDALSRASIQELAEDAARQFGGEEAVREALPALSAALQFRNLPAGTGKYAWPEVAGRLSEDLERLRAALNEIETALAACPDAETLVRRVQAILSRLDVLTEQGDPSDFRWFETGGQGAFGIHTSPIEPGGTLRSWIGESEASWIMTSASLAVGRSFTSFASQIGVDEYRSVLEGSPFDYPRQAMLCLPAGLPQVQADGYTQAVVAAAEPLLKAVAGGTFLLFTSHRALQKAALLLRELGLRNPLFVQGESPQVRLLDDFREAGNGILCGTASFWKGVDVKGSALELVVIDRLPFTWPGDPLFKARLEHCAAHGGAPFPDIQVPEAVLALKQGAGRLIRDAADCGVLMICDPRLTTMPYGRRFLDSLPPMRRTTSTAEAAAFLNRIPAHECAGI
ncbi:MAG: ATP-dependent DNA helicase [Gammaproteobacteria bacterium]|nr:ATP-dependent DNA helicase [Gammaproteobacteria bacterium]